ncbi:MAG: hypothetical protein LH650_01395 [Chloroflexi bacterium]|nr:hypothetical protein [Chloroflexota bacterium]
METPHAAEPVPTDEPGVIPVATVVGAATIAMRSFVSHGADHEDHPS